MRPMPDTPGASAESAAAPTSKTAPIASTAGAAPVSPLLAAWALALLLGLQPIATDLYLPGLPLLTREQGRDGCGASSAGDRRSLRGGRRRRLC